MPDSQQRRLDAFAVAIGHVLSEEGGVVAHPLDPGGLTNRGITEPSLRYARHTYPDLRLPQSVVGLTEAQAIEIYRRSFWKPIRGDELPRGLSLAVLDAAVNHGYVPAVQWLQQAVAVPVDGSIGPKTLAAVRARKVLDVLGEFSARRTHFYMLLSTNATFGLGWARRVFRTYAAAANEV